MRHFVLPWVLVSMLTGCSWQNTLHAAGQTPEYLRLKPHVWVADPPRFRLPANAGVSLIDQGQAPRAWIDAADAGLGRVFASDGPALYRVQVLWPAPEFLVPPLAESGFKAGLLGITQMPGIPERQALPVRLEDLHGEMIARVELHISPQLWGPVWSDPELLSMSFVRLAEVLSGR